MQIPISLEPANDSPGLLPLPDAEVLFFSNFLSAPEADSCYQDLLTQTSWRQDSLNFGGKSVLIPRLQAWVGDRKSRYRYSGLALTPLPWTPLLDALKTRVEKVAGAPFNSVLLNYYRNGMDSVAWHSDDEKELGDEPVIASLSLGVTRRFELKHRRRKLPKTCCDLSHGSLLVMGRGIQQNWHHQVPKQPGISDGRINLTFRYIYPDLHEGHFL